MPPKQATLTQFLTVGKRPAAGTASALKKLDTAMLQAASSATSLAGSDPAAAAATATEPPKKRVRINAQLPTSEPDLHDTAPLASDAVPPTPPADAAPLPQQPMRVDPPVSRFSSRLRALEDRTQARHDLLRARFGTTLSGPSALHAAQKRSISLALDDDVVPESAPAPAAAAPAPSTAMDVDPVAPAVPTTAPAPAPVLLTRPDEPRVGRALQLLGSPRKSVDVGSASPATADAALLPTPATTTVPAPSAAAAAAAPLKKPSSLRARLAALEEARKARDAPVLIRTPPRATAVDETKPSSPSAPTSPTAAESTTSAILPHIADLISPTSPNAVSAAPRSASAAAAIPRVSWSRVATDIDQRKYPLPAAFEHLVQIFDALERTVLFNLTRGETAGFHKIQRPVELVCHRAFSLDHLRAIKAVFPDAYTYEPLRVLHQGARIDSVNLEFNPHWETASAAPATPVAQIKAATADAAAASLPTPSTPPRPMHPAAAAAVVSGPSTPASSRRPSLSTHAQSPSTTTPSLSSSASLLAMPVFRATEMPKRRVELRRRLIRLVSDAHAAFLASIDATATWNPHLAGAGAVDGVSPWHPRFDLDAVALPKAELPRVPRIGDPGMPSRVVIPTAASVRADAAAALAAAKAKMMPPAPATAAPVPDAPAAPAPAPATAGGKKVNARFASLLQRVREKEKVTKELAAAGLTPEQTQRKLMLSRAGMVVDIMATFFHHIGKPVCLLSQLAQKVADSYPNIMSVASATAHVELIATIVPAWCAVETLGVKKFVRVAYAAMELAAVKAQLEAARSAIGAAAK
ncbi:hypothetical protein H9P43_004712 [Blastocladiella emersonii ATCC 22665]|nr:hypothetical protein H9P43_004712 [Blastocladiella emersonii ATCC 22665]